MAMAMAGPPAAPDDDRTPYQGRGVAGGKLKSRRAAGGAAGSSALRRNTPYERPPLGRHASAGPQAAAHLTRVSASQKTPPKGSWLGGGFVSSASKILTNGASYLFSSFFGNPRIEKTSENENAANAASSVVEEELQLDIPKEYAEADGLNFENEKSPANDGDADAKEESQFKEMEFFLKQNTLTREQCNRFIDVLKAKVQDSDAVDTEAVMPISVEQSQRALARIEAVRAGSTSHPDSQRWREERHRYRQEKGIGGKSRVYEQGDFNDHLFVEDGKLPSPRDIAKKYMDSRSSRASGSTLLLQSPAFKDEDHRSPLHLALRNSKTQGLVDGGLQKNKSTSAEIVLQSIARTSRTPFQRPGENLGMDAKPKSGSSWTPYQTPITGGREMLKRRNMVLEDVGTLAIPVRRTRIRTSSMTSHGLLASGNVLGPRSSSSASEPPAAALTSSSLRRHSALGFDREKTPSANRIIDEKRDEINGLAFVPIQSSRTAQMILETLERMSPSPKGKSLDGELALIRERPPTRLSPSMLNKKAQRTMQTIEVVVPPPDALEATQVEDLRNVPSVKEPFIHPSKLSMQSLKGKENLEGPRVGKVPATSFCNAKVSEANGFEHKTKMPSLGVSHAPESILLKLPDVPVSEQSKSKGFRMSADFEELLSDDEGQGSAQALLRTNAITENSNVLVASDTITFSVSAATITEANVPVSPAAPTTANAIIPTLEVQTSSSLGATISLSEASPKLTSGFAFPLSSFSGAKLEPPPTPKPIPSPLSQIDKSNTMSTSALLLQNTNVSSSPTAPVFPVLSSLSVEKSDTKKGSLFSTPLSISQGQFGAKPTIDSSNLNVAATSIFPESFEKTQSTSAVTSSAFVPKTSASMGSSLSFVSASAFGSSYSAPSLPSFSFDGASSLSSSVSAFAQSISVNSSTTTSAAVIISPISSAATGNVFSTPVSSVFPSSSTSTTPSVFAASSTLAGTSSSEKSLIASQPKTIFGLVGVGQGAIPSSQQSMSTILTPIFGNSVSASSTSSTSFVFGNSASSVSTTTTLSPSFGTSPLSFGSAVSTTSPIFGAASGAPFGLTNAATVFGGNTTFSTSGSSIPSFGMASAKSFGNFGQDAGSRSSPADNTFGSFRVPTPTSVGFSLTPTSASSTMPFSYGSTAASTSTMFTFGTSSSATDSPIFGAKSPIFQPPLVFGSANTMPSFGTPTVSVMSNDSNEQTIMEDNMSEEPAQITPTGPSQISLFGTPPPQAASPFTFGAPSNNASPGQGLFTFGGQSMPTPVPSAFGTTAQSQFAQPGQSGALDNPFAGGFALGSGGERGRKYIKAKRTVAKRGK